MTATSVTYDPFEGADACFEAVHAPSKVIYLFAYVSILEKLLMAL